MKVRVSNLKKQIFPSRAHARRTGPRATKENVRYCIVVIGDLVLILRFLCDLDIDPV